MTNTIDGRPKPPDSGRSDDRATGGEEASGTRAAGAEPSEGGAAGAEPTDSRLGRFMSQHGLASYEGLGDRAAADPDWFWRAVMDFHQLHFFHPFDQLLDASKGPEWAQWCIGGTTNLAYNCLDRTLQAGRGQHAAIEWEGEDGASRTLSYD